MGDMISDMMIIASLSLGSNLISQGILSNEGAIDFVLDVAAGIFSIVLFAVTLYAWTKRERQPTLLILSMGFLAFFIRQLVAALPIGTLHGKLFGSVMDFVILALFFVALVVRPRRGEPVREKATYPI